ncbi:MAG: molybdate ABC transporter substrate-binding protein [Nocardioidaceae bacterium]
MRRPSTHRVPPPRRAAALLAVVLAALLPGCGAGSALGPAGAGGADGSRQGGGVSGDVVVFAASSLTEAFTRVGRAFEDAHPGVSVTFSFGGSSSLGPQVLAGAPADVFASASPETMTQVVRADAAAGRPVVFARNRLQIAVPPGNPGDVQGLGDLADADLALAVCAPEVPCGAAAEQAFSAAGVTARPDTLEQEVKAVLTKVELGEVDAGLVYRTDVRAAGGRVRGIDFPESADVVNDYPIVDLADAPNPPAAQAFVGFVRSAQGREALDDAGFGLP